MSQASKGPTDLLDVVKRSLPEVVQTGPAEKDFLLAHPIPIDHPAVMHLTLFAGWRKGAKLLTKNKKVFGIRGPPDLIEYLYKTLGREKD